MEGVMGDPTVATPEKGAAIADAALEQLVRAIEAFANASLGGASRGTAGLDS
jgi:creatinine amidohydrolase/Fe(II)-dependent formamide hydrolase-like protein